MGVGKKKPAASTIIRESQVQPQLRIWGVLSLEKKPDVINKFQPAISFLASGIGMNTHLMVWWRVKVFVCHIYPHFFNFIIYTHRASLTSPQLASYQRDQHNCPIQVGPSSEQWRER